jgi:cell division protein FtsB
LQVEEVYKNLDDKVQKESRKFMSEFNLRQLLSVLAILSFFTWYGYIILFGKNSYSVVKELEMEKRVLRAEIKELEESNERLQRSYFNLKIVRGEEYEN